MSGSPQDQLATMLGNIPEKTGKSLAQWHAVLRATGLEKHGALVKLLKTEHGVTHGFANLIVAKYLEGDGPADLVEAQYSDAKAALKPIHDEIVAFAKSLGDDVEIAPKKSSVSLRRKKQFALITPATKTRVDLGLALKGDEPTGRLEPYNAMCSHRVRLESKEAFDKDVRTWMREAYTRQG